MYSSDIVFTVISAKKIQGTSLIATIQYILTCVYNNIAIIVSHYSLKLNFVCGFENSSKNSTKFQISEDARCGYKLDEFYQPFPPCVAFVRFPGG